MLQHKAASIQTRSFSQKKACVCACVRAVCGKHVNKYKICSLIHSYLFQGAMDSGSAGKGLRKGGQKKRRVETQYARNKDIIYPTTRTRYVVLTYIPTAVIKRRKHPRDTCRKKWTRKTLHHEYCVSTLLFFCPPFLKPFPADPLSIAPWNKHVLFGTKMIALLQGSMVFCIVYAKHVDLLRLMGSF